VQNLKNRLIIAGTLVALATIGTYMNRGSNGSSLQAAGGPSVTIESPIPLPVKSADNPAHHPFTTTCSNESGATYVTTISCATLPLTPPGVETVIQGVNMLITTNPSIVATNSSFEWIQGGSIEQVYLPAAPPVANAFGGSDVVQQTVTFYADPSTSTNCQAILAAAIPATITCVITGYTVAP